MNDIQSDVTRFVATFVAEVTELARRAAIDSLETALNGRGPRKANGGAAAVVPRASGRGAKRAPAELDQLIDRFVQFVTANPGLRIEQINKALGTTTKELALPVRKALDDGAVQTNGQKRSTAYFARSKRKGKKAAN